MMNLTIDPDVFVTAQTGNSDCLKQLENLAQNQSLFTLAVDREKLLSQQYNEIISKSLERGKAEKSMRIKMVARFLSKMITHNDRKLVINPSSLPSNMQDKVRRNCLEPVEQQMLKMAARQSQTRPVSGLTILLTGPPGVNVRCLHRQDLKKDFEEEIKGLIVRCASERKKIGRWKTKLFLSEFEKALHVNLFEQTVENLIAWRYNSPYKNIQEKVEKEEIDVYCYQTDGEPRIVCVGECKLRSKNESDKIKRSEILQLEKKLNAARSFENKRKKVSENFEIMAFMISNATDMEDDAWEYALSLGIKFCHARMPKNWQDNPLWKISDQDLSFLPETRYRPG